MDTSKQEKLENYDDCEEDLLGCRTLRAWHNLPKGCVAYNSPAEMKVGKEEKIEVIISRDTPDELTQYLNLKGQFIKLKDIKVSPRMKVNLNGKNDFEIYPMSSSEQAIVGDYAQWAWKIIPKSSGSKKLILFIEVVLEMKGFNDRKTNACNKENEIEVKTNLAYQLAKFVKSYWQGIIVTISAIIGVILSLNKLG